MKTKELKKVFQDKLRLKVNFHLSVWQQERERENWKGKNIFFTFSRETVKRA